MLPLGRLVSLDSLGFLGHLPPISSLPLLRFQLLFFEQHTLECSALTLPGCSLVLHKLLLLLLLTVCFLLLLELGQFVASNLLLFRQLPLNIQLLNLSTLVLDLLSEQPLRFLVLLNLLQLLLLPNLVPLLPGYLLLHFQHLLRLGVLRGRIFQPNPLIGSRLRIGIVVVVAQYCLLSFHLK